MRTLCQRCGMDSFDIWSGKDLQPTSGECAGNGVGRYKILQGNGWLGNKDCRNGDRRHKERSIITICNRYECASDHAEPRLVSLVARE